MNRPWLNILCLVACLLPASWCAADFTRFQVILDRMPFGVEAPPPPPPGQGPEANKPTPPAELFTRTLKMCAVTRHALTGRLQVGLVDTTSKKNYFLTVGDTEDGITLVEADYDGEKALLRKGDQENWLAMSDVATMAAVAGPPSAPGMARPGFPPGMMIGQPPGGPGASGASSPTASRPGFPSPTAFGRLPSVTAAPGQPPSATTASPVPSVPTSSPLTGIASRYGGNQVRRRDLTVASTNQVPAEALKKHLEQYQMDLIRAGGAKGPPLPMALTPEMDQQLVKEGVLPPLPPQ